MQNKLFQAFKHKGQGIKGKADNGRHKLSKERARAAALNAMLIMVIAISPCIPTYASAAMTQGLSSLQDIVASFVSAVGVLIVLWGIFEWGNAMQSQDGMMQSQAFKRIGGGIVMTIAPQILSAIVTTS